MCLVNLNGFPTWQWAVTPTNRTPQKLVRYLNGSKHERLSYMMWFEPLAYRKQIGEQLLLFLPGINLNQLILSWNCPESSNYVRTSFYRYVVPLKWKRHRTDEISIIGRSDNFCTEWQKFCPYDTGIAWLSAFSLLVHPDSKRHIKLSILSFFTLKGTHDCGNVRKRHIGTRGPSQ